MGDEGVGVTGKSVSSRRRRLIASACRLGGPRRRLGLSNVQGMSSDAHARHGGPLSSHCDELEEEQTERKLHDRAYLYLSDATGITSLSQSVGLLILVGSAMFRTLMWRM